MNSLLDKLQDHICIVSFVKVDGTQRKMRCTLREDHIPKFESKTGKKHNGNIMPVWDLDNNDWRAFRIENVISVVVDDDVPSVEYFHD